MTDASRDSHREHFVAELLRNMKTLVMVAATPQITNHREMSKRFKIENMEKIENERQQTMTREQCIPAGIDQEKKLSDGRKAVRSKILHERS